MKIDPTTLDPRALHRLFFALNIPRPVALVSTIGKDGVFNVGTYASVLSVIVPRPLLCIGTATEWNPAEDRYAQDRDTLVNVRYSKDFVVNFVDEALAEAQLIAGRGYPIGVDEFKEAGLTPVKADIVKAPMVAESPINSECKLVKIIEFGDSPFTFNLIFGEVVRVHVKDEFYADGEIQPSRLKAIGKLGTDFYCRTTDVFEMKEPDDRPW